MVDDRIQTTMTAAKALYHGISRYGEAFAGVLNEARSDLSRTDAHFQMVLVESERHLLECQRATESAQLALDRCEEDCDVLVEALKRSRAAEMAAQQRVQRNRAACERFRQCVADFRGATRAIESDTSSNVNAAKQELFSYAEDVNRYLSSRTGGAT